MKTTKHRWFTKFLCMLAVACFLAAGPARAADELRFIVMGDSRPILGTLKQSPPFKQILWETDFIGPDLAVHVGDLVFGYLSESGELDRQYDDLLQTLAPVRTPMYYAIGNHEIGAKGGREQFAQRVSETYFSFDVNDSHFIILDSDCCGTGDTGTLGQEQFAWLEKDLAGAKTAKNIFVFMHKPMFAHAQGGGSSWRDTDMRDKMHQMFMDADNVRAVFAGHSHIYRGFKRDGLQYYITGGAGAETNHPEHEGFYHYLIVTVNNKSIDVKVVEPYHLWYECDPACDGKNDTVKVNLVNTLYSNMPLRLRGVEVDMPDLPENKKYKISGGIITASRDNKDGSISLRVNALLNSIVGFHRFTLEPVDAD